MTGPEHYRAAEALLAEAKKTDLRKADALATQAHAHATLALTAATIEPEVLEYVGEPWAAGREWGMVLS